MQVDSRGKKRMFYMHIPLGEYRQLLVTYLAPQRRRVALLTLCLLGGIGLQLLNPQLLRAFIDAVTSPHVPSFLVQIALLFIGVALVQQLVTIVATYLSERVGWTATNALRVDLALHLLRLDLSFHKEYTPGALIERVDGDVTALANFFSQFVIRIFGNLLLLVGILIVLMWIDWRVSLALILFAVIVLFALLAVRNIATPHWKAFREASANLYGFLEERLTGTEDIRSNGAQSYMLRRLFTHTRERLRTAWRARLIGAVPWGLPILFFAGGNLLAFVLAAWLYRAGAMTLGTAFIIYYYTLLIYQPIMGIMQEIEDFQLASAGLVRIRELLQAKSKLEDGPGVTFPIGPLAVEFEDVNFGYGEEEMVIKDLSFRIEPGKVLGLLGRTGSGKTSLTRLIFRLYDPATGIVRLGEQDLRFAAIIDLRKRIGMVTQDVQLFHATVRDNLTFFEKSISDEHILQVLEDLGLMGWYNKLADGLDTMLAAGGGGLSAGEAQLLAFTRVFLHDPGLVILDEASSRLDPATESLIEQAVDKLLKGRTGIVIAHRLHTIQRVDTIMLLDQGRVSEYGERVQLAANPTSRFSRLLQTAHEANDVVEDVIVPSRSITMKGEQV
jgi:ATP-binding cassette subfamily B protein